MERADAGGPSVSSLWTSALAKGKPSVATRDAEWRVQWEQFVNRFPLLAALDQFAPPEDERGSIEGWPRIEEALGFTEDDFARRVCLMVLLRVVFLKTFPPANLQRVDDAEFNRGLAQISKSAMTLILFLLPNPVATLPMYRSSMQPHVRDALHGALGLSLEDNLRLLKHLIDLWLHTETASKARSHSARLRRLISLLAWIYQDFSGRQAGISYDALKMTYTGPFFRFIIACLELYRPEETQNPNALGKKIQRCLKTKPPRDFLWTIFPDILMRDLSILQRSPEAVSLLTTPKPPNEQSCS